MKMFWAQESYAIHLRIPFDVAAKKAGLDMSSRYLDGFIRPGFARALHGNGTTQPYAVFRPTDDGGTIAFIPMEVDEEYARERIQQILGE